jgi:hypothetical protein
MNQRKDTYRAALARDRAVPGPYLPPRRATTLNSRYVRITIELDPGARRTVERWVRPPASVLARTGTAAVRLLAVVTAKPPSPGRRGRT